MSAKSFRTALCFVPLVAGLAAMGPSAAGAAETLGMDAVGDVAEEAPAADLATMSVAYDPGGALRLSATMATPLTGNEPWTITFALSADLGTVGCASPNLVGIHATAWISGLITEPDATMTLIGRPGLLTATRTLSGSTVTMSVRDPGLANRTFRCASAAVSVGAGTEERVLDDMAIDLGEAATAPTSPQPSPEPTAVTTAAPHPTARITAAAVRRGRALHLAVAGTRTRIQVGFSRAGRRVRTVAVRPVRGRASVSTGRLRPGLYLVTVTLADRRIGRRVVRIS